jgi:hypothetical protein
VPNPRVTVGGLNRTTTVGRLKALEERVGRLPSPRPIISLNGLSQFLVRGRGEECFLWGTRLAAPRALEKLKAVTLVML